VIDKISAEVVWQFSEGLDYQHEALMIPASFPRAGQVVLFNNGLGDRHAYRRSSVQLIDPVTFEKVWEYSAPYFYSSVSGVSQPLENGNVLIGSTRGGRAFEVTPDGDTVWQWEPPYLPMRPIRYPRDHCPQLAEMDWPRPVARTRATPYLDKALYDFLLPRQPNRWLRGWERRALLAGGHACRELILPSDAVMHLEYGLQREALKDRTFAARFVVEIRDKASGETRRILDDEVHSDQDPIQRKFKASLATRAFTVVDVCLDAKPIGETHGVSPREAIIWLPPQFRSRPRAGDQLEPELTQAERVLRERQLRAIGYIQ